MEYSSASLWPGGEGRGGGRGVVEGTPVAVGGPDAVEVSGGGWRVNGGRQGGIEGG